ncbi:MAG: DUF6242 domain-containing protein [Candidatus Amulumruptor caecigallinarius]|nr:DUF6242 domain-containing protein [Candidatus Amulumruptor caecigallinarius]MCM1396563.1 DUF6242 domain-containing protein [Candidatus Amulumruptor caecigallinarius]MCM1453379.1 DUF6242 domain-containing protein [bacterium]
MKHRLVLAAVAVIALASTFGCNNKDDDEVAVVNYSNTAITSFTLQDNDAVLRNLSTVFFSIDLVEAQVFNADSLPKGTDVSSLAVTIGTGVLSKAQLTYKDASGAEQTVDYLANPAGTINFANGPVKLDVTSYDGAASRTYTIKVNVHQTDADLFYWAEAAHSALPTTLAGPLTGSATVNFNGHPTVLTTDATGACLATCDDIDAAQWSYLTPKLPAGADPASFTATTDALWIVAAGELYSSTDGTTWSSAATPMDWLYGAYGDTVTGNVRNADGSYSLVTYPGGATTALPAGFPVSGTSQLVSYDNKWMDTPVAMIAGGRKADGTLSGNVWAYDGSRWAAMNRTPLPEAEGMTLVPYYIYRTATTTWQSTKYPAMLVFGGTLADGTLNPTLYYSLDYGMNWIEGPETMQLPADLGQFSGARALVYTRTLSADTWIPSEVSTLAPWMTAAAAESNDTNIPGVTPITEWECPYIYLFGGTDAAGALRTDIWRGYINKLTFKPLQ